LIPAGTGSALRNYKKIGKDRDMQRKPLTVEPRASLS